MYWLYWMIYIWKFSIKKFKKVLVKRLNWNHNFRFQISISVYFHSDVSYFSHIWQNAVWKQCVNYKNHCPNFVSNFLDISTAWLVLHIINKLMIISRPNFLFPTLTNNPNIIHLFHLLAILKTNFFGFNHFIVLFAPELCHPNRKLL